MSEKQGRNVGLFVMAVCMLLCSGALTAGELKIWNYHVLDDALRIDAPTALTPLLIVGSRNGTFSGAVAVQSSEPIKGLRATVRSTPAAGHGSIPDGPGEKVQVRYAMPWTDGRGLPPGLDILLEKAPDEIPLVKDRALVGVWVTITIPESTAAGIYQGTLRIEAEGAAAKVVPIELRVADWVLPNPENWRTWIEMMQSPDTLALEYEEPLWSDRHWDMIARSFKLMSTSSSRTVYVPILRETNQGNEQSMVRWIRGKDGSLRPDFSIMEKYLDLAQANLGNLRQVIFYVWDAYLVTSHRKTSFAERPKEPGQAQQRWDLRQGGLMVTLVDEATGQGGGRRPAALHGRTQPGHLATFLPGVA